MTNDILPGDLRNTKTKSEMAKAKFTKYTNRTTKIHAVPCYISGMLPEIHQAGLLPQPGYYTHRCTLCRKYHILVKSSQLDRCMFLHDASRRTAASLQASSLSCDLDMVHVLDFIQILQKRAHIPSLKVVCSNDRLPASGEAHK